MWPRGDPSRGAHGDAAACSGFRGRKIMRNGLQAARFAWKGCASNAVLLRINYLIPPFFAAFPFRWAQSPEWNLHGPNQRLRSGNAQVCVRPLLPLLSPLKLPLLCLPCVVLWPPRLVAGLRFLHVHRSSVETPCHQYMLRHRCRQAAIPGIWRQLGRSNITRF